MSIPLDRLYHYIESVANKACGDVVIYRFYPHGSKKIQDLTPLKDYPYKLSVNQPIIYCNDQEPLNFDFYHDPVLCTDRLTELIEKYQLD